MTRRRARFGWFDTIDDFEVAKLLLGTAEAWAKENRNDNPWTSVLQHPWETGVLVEGYENIPPFNCLYNYPYYNDFVTALGYVKECDWVQYKIAADQPLREVTRIAGLLKQRYNLHEGSLNKLKKDKKMVRYFFDVYNGEFREVRL